MKVTDRRVLGRSGIEVTAFGLGGAPLAGLYHDVSEADARAAIDGAWDAGLRYFDTAPYYGYTKSEHRFGQALRQHARSEFVLSTKVGRLLKPGNPQSDENGWVNPLPFEPHYDYSYSGIMRSYEDSQQRLGMTQIDILLVHDIGRTTHHGEHDHYINQLTAGGGLQALDELRNSGQIRAVGLGVNEWEIVHDVMQVFDLDCCLLAGRYTLLEQQTLSPFLDNCVARGVGIILGGPFNSGVLTGNRKYNYAEAPARVLERVAALQAVSDEFGVPLPAAALQFPLAHPAVATCIPGGKTLAQLQQNCAWFEQAIPAAFWQTLKQRGLLHEAAPLPGEA
ncbi:aldo/keto reductase [Silvimonas iriomotensis]|uniref:Oxidoreductase n=1 Tax=Silvimonas iriomotensis TaxID=449662 RepID=A0ABQ2P7Z4_9NEIS|nr:aldo/keto reductase [Silvimonas iriomotensis]GGP20113.1 oxidoreductase [Silvimonas iriomotensis]